MSDEGKAADEIAEARSVSPTTVDRPRPGTKLKLLAGRVVELGLADSISPKTVRSYLKLTNQEARKAAASVLHSRSRKASKSAPTMGFALPRSMSRVCPAMFEPEEVVVEKVTEYGPHIPTVCRRLEEGCFD